MALAQDDHLCIAKSKIYMTQDFPVLSVVLPAYKERDNLEILIPQIEDAFKDIPMEIIVVDDNSKDGTKELAQALQITYGNVVLVERPGLLGIGSALRDGYNTARGEYILSSDADLSFRVEDMRSLFGIIQRDWDLVLGYKVYVSEEVRQQSFREWCKTYVFSQVSNGIIGVLAGITLKNYNTNFRAIRSSTWEKLRTVEDRHFFLLETILRAKRSGARITEMPVSFHMRKFGESKVSFFRQAPGYFLKLLRYTFFVRSS